MYIIQIKVEALNHGVLHLFTLSGLQGDLLELVSLCGALCRCENGSAKEQDLMAETNAKHGFLSF